MAIPKEKKIITIYGRKLFRLFREQQMAHGHKGCDCNTCAADMVAALQKLVEQENLPIGK